MPEYYRRNDNTNCVVCNKAIYRRPIEIERSKKGVFCSQLCYGLASRKEHPCTICGKMILAGANKKTCSRGCANKHRAGIKYKINRPRDRVKHHQSLKIRLIKERNGRCERCGYEKYETLVMHHKDRNRQNNNLENLELICPNCHAEEHYFKNSWLSKQIK